MSETQIWSEGGNSVWQFPLTVPAEELFELREMLSAFEFAQAESSHLPESRLRFIVRRGILRRLLGIHLGCDPHRIEFKSGEWGKPYVVGRDVHFSASSSGAFGLIALSRDGRVGVDIENHNEVLMSADMHLIDEDEYQSIIESDDSVELYFRIWARKEACIKLTGQGIRFRMTDLCVWPDDSDRGTVLMPATVEVQDLSVPVGYSAAVAWRA